MSKKEYTQEEKLEFSTAGRRVRGFFKLLNINNKTQEYLPLKRAVQFKMVKPERSYEELLQDIVDDDVSPACCTISKAEEIVSSAVEDFLLDVKLSDAHQKEYDRFETVNEKTVYVIALIAEKVKTQNLED